LGTLREEISRTLPAPLRLPDEIAAALDWIDIVGATGRTRRSDRLFGVLDPNFVDAMGGSCIAFEPTDPGHAPAWTGNTNPAITNRLAPFIRTGGDGSYAAFWLDDHGRQQIVHLGSGSGSLMTGVMVRSPLDFLRLLAIGYEELCWPEVLHLPPHAAAMNPELLVLPLRFRHWLTSTFDVSIPTTALEIMLPPADMDRASDDPFSCWMDRIRG
jgi:hypothetical protein